MIDPVWTRYSCSQLTWFEAKKDKAKKKKRNKRKSNSGTEGEPPKCGRCGKTGHKTSACWDDPKNADQRPDGYRVKRKKTGNQKPEQSFTQDQMTFLMKNFTYDKNKKSKKRKDFDDDSDEEPGEDQDAQLDKMISFGFG